MNQGTSKGSETSADEYSTRQIQICRVWSFLGDIWKVIPKWFAGKIILLVRIGCPPSCSFFLRHQETCSEHDGLLLAPLWYDSNNKELCSTTLCVTTYLWGGGGHQSLLFWTETFIKYSKTRLFLIWHFRRFHHSIQMLHPKSICTCLRVSVWLLQNCIFFLKPISATCLQSALNETLQ